MGTTTGGQRASAVVVMLLALGGGTMRAHDMWIEPATFAPASGQIVPVRLRVGQDLIGDPLPRDPALIKQFVVEDADGRHDVIGRPGSDPAGLIRIEKAGLARLGYASHPSLVTLTGEKFAQYLNEEGLEAVAAIRARRGQTGSIRERFSRCAKSLLLIAKDGTGTDQAFGFALELVAERNPYLMAAGEELPVRLTYQGKPLAGALVVAFNQRDPSAKLSARSDANGRARFRLPRAGMWLVKAVHMIPATETDADWESFWASLTFDLPAADHATH
jgi:uncharacterized GH25 family protein